MTAAGPELFRPQVFSALELFERGDLDPARTTGAWAGEIGMVQMLPGDILENGIDADGDGVVSLKTSAPDALTSGAAMLSDLGWRPDEPWIQEVVVPSDLDWSLTGLDTTKTPEEWASLGVRARDGDFAAGSLPTLDHFAARAQRSGVPRLSEFRRLFRVESKLCLRSDRRLFRHSAGRRASL